MEENNSFSIKNWNEDDRPREKMLLKGRIALSDAELVAILIGSGSRNESAVSLSQRILASVNNNLSELGRLSTSKLMEFKGIGEAKAISIAAATELGRRRRTGEALERQKITSSNSVFEFIQPVIGELPHEEFWILYLNNSNKVIKSAQLSKGSTIISTEYMDTSTRLSTGGFQYTNGTLDFFPHAEGYVSAMPSSIGGGSTTYSFRYVFNYTDHLRNIRL